MRGKIDEFPEWIYHPQVGNPDVQNPFQINSRLTYQILLLRQSSQLYFFETEVVTHSFVLQKQLNLISKNINPYIKWTKQHKQVIHSKHPLLWKVLIRIHIKTKSSLLSFETNDVFDVYMKLSLRSWFLFNSTILK